MFLTWGFITIVNGMLLGHLKHSLSITTEQARIFNYIFYASYFIMGIPAGYIIKRIGFKKGLFTGLLIAASSVFLLVTGAQDENYTLVVAGVSLIACGFTFLQVAANPYVIFMGKPEEGAKNLSIAGAYNSFGTWIAPFLGTLIINAQPAGTRQSTELVVLPYIFLATIFVGLAVLVHFSELPDIKSTKEVDTNVKEDNHKKYVVQYPHVLLGFFAIFCYVGAEVGIAEFITKDYLVGYLGIEKVEGVISYMVAYYWGCIMVGRFIGGNSLKDSLTGKKALVWCTVICLMLTLLSMIGEGYAAMFVLIATGLFHSIMWPVIFSMGIHGMGKYTEYASSLLIMGIIGGAAVAFGIHYVMSITEAKHLALFIPVACYIFILYYAKKGHVYKMEEKY
jgi:FHS family L-fucose permease-like MFS transporter